MDSQHVLQYKLGGIALVAILMPFDVESDCVESFSEEFFRPSSQSAEEIDYERLHGRYSGSCRRRNGISGMSPAGSGWDSARMIRVPMYLLT